MWIALNDLHSHYYDYCIMTRGDLSFKSEKILLLVIGTSQMPI
jgi:hypothetical protein